MYLWESHSSALERRMEREEPERCRRAREREEGKNRAKETDRKEAVAR